MYCINWLINGTLKWNFCVFLDLGLFLGGEGFSFFHWRFWLFANIFARLANIFARFKKEKNNCATVPMYSSQSLSKPGLSRKIWCHSLKHINNSILISEKDHLFKILKAPLLIQLLDISRLKEHNFHNSLKYT